MAGVFGGSDTEAGSDSPGDTVVSAPPDPEQEIEDVILDYSHAGGINKCDFVTDRFFRPTSGCAEFFTGSEGDVFQDVFVEDIEVDGDLAEAVRNYAFRGRRFQQRLFLSRTGVGWFIDGQGNSK